MPSRRWATPIFCFVAVLQVGFGQDAATATTVAVKRARDFIIVAADSLVTGDDRRPRNYGKCKITLLDDRSFFASAGVVSSKGNGKNDATRFNAHQVARVSYGPSRDLRVVADAWADSMEEKFNVQRPSWKRAIVDAMKSFNAPDRVFIQGIFGSAHEAIAAWESTVNYNEISPMIRFSHTGSHEIAENEAGIRLWGTVSGGDVIRELLLGGTRNAAIWRASIAKESMSRGYQDADRYAFEMKAALDYAISAKVDPAIGGDVAALILQRDRPARWFNKPPVCKD
jgi:hypothetical protein